MFTLIKKSQGAAALMSYYGSPRLLKSMGNLKFGSELASLSSNQLVLITPSEYFYFEKGYLPLVASKSNVPREISLILDSWTIDIINKSPQYLANPYFLFNHQLPNGHRIMGTGFVIKLKKTFQHNNARLLLHSGSSANDVSSHLFFLDIDEDGK